jgi:hypothetical protein
MDTHVKVLGILNIIGGVLGVCGAVVLLLVFGFTTGVVAIDGDADAAFVVPFLGLTGLTLVAVTLVFSLPGIIVGYGLYRLRPWARLWGIVLSALSLVVFPFGTIVGAYGLWVLLSKNTEPLFAPGAAVG